MFPSCLVRKPHRDFLRFTCLRKFEPFSPVNPGTISDSQIEICLVGCLHGDFRSLRDRPRVDPSVYMVIIGSAQVFESI